MMESKNFDFTSIIKIVRENFKIFVVVAIAAIVLSAVFSGPQFIKPRYKSVAVIYPVNVNTYSDESETEQMLQMFESSRVRDSIVKKFNLYQRYGIEPGQPSSRHYLHLEYNDRFVSSKTKYESILLEVLDEDPEVAKRMADEVLKQVNNTVQNFRNRRGNDRASSFKDQMNYQMEMIDSLEQRIKALSTGKRLLNYEAQTRELVRGYLEELGRNKNSEAAAEIENWLEDMQESGSLIQTLQRINEYSAEQYSSIADKYFDWRAMGSEHMNYLDVVVKPEVSDKKSWPVRWIIVLTALIGALLLTLFILSIVKYGK